MNKRSLVWLTDMVDMHVIKWSADATASSSLTLPAQTGSLLRMQPMCGTYPSCRRDRLKPRARMDCRFDLGSVSDLYDHL
ncbi:MAG: hypothetical protein AAF340_06320 [Pseudomonadota bacterium]